MTMRPFIGQSAIANSLLDLIHTDVCGPLNTLARGGYSYFITFTDDHSRYGYVCLMRYKSEAFGTFKEYRLEEESNPIGYDSIHDEFYRIAPILWGYALETVSKLLNMAPSKTIADEMRCYLRNQVKHLSKMTQYHLNLWFPLMVFQSSVDQPENLDHSERYGFVGLTSQLENDPKTYGEAYPPKGVKPVGCKWVYKSKLGADGEVTAFKARLVTKGYTQGPGVYFEETYSPVAMAKSIRILLAIAAWYDYEIWQMDVKTAFLNGYVEEEIFMDQSKGFTTI
ncbi:Retrovirus-related Pol polyprotein from transposon TNT 1-94 [Sesamum angolense]|uniref:Retrovirus-related Pol polyprotein from transposon TNT 1-94 n=1 Tax=Sesamum angolense TaxID=2727404 RepID=A0AAE2BU07_9LAMI|nr:Retrovirus-related Pol polyprotein from transposon TNT 1-94 [Sesamum angolense]